MVYDILANSTWGDGNADAQKMNAAANYAINRWPEAQYHGPMFRVIRFGIEEFLNFNDNAAVLQAIRSYKHNQGKQFFSFAKTVKGVSDFVTISREYGGDDYEPFSKEDISVLVMIQQVGPAVDLAAAMKKFRKDKPTTHMQGASVGEVLSMLQNNASIKLYHVIGLGEEMDHDDYDDDEEYDEDEMGTHQEGDYYYRPDQFEQMKRDLLAQYQHGENDLPARKKFHKKSKLKRYKGTAFADY